MSGTQKTPRAIVWTDADKQAVTERLIRAMGSRVTPIGVGGIRSAEVDQFARRLGCDPRDDLRHMLVEWPCEYVLLTTMGGVGRQDLAAATGSRGSVVLALEPTVGGFDDLTASTGRGPVVSVLGIGKDRVAPRRSAGSAAGRGSAFTAPAPPVAAAGGDGHARVVWLASIGRSVGWGRAADPLVALGRPRVINYRSFGRSGEWSLYARVFDAWGFVLSLIGLPDVINATITGPLGEVSEYPRSITGHLTAHARLSDGGAVVLCASDRAGAWERGASVIGDHGRLDVTDQGYELFDAEGGLVDRFDPTVGVSGGKTGGVSGGESGFADLVAGNWQRLIEGQADPLMVGDSPYQAHCLACALTCLLSARTGQPESPGRLLAMYGHK